MDAELRELLSQTITHAAPDGTYSDRGQPNFGSATSYACLIEPAKGEEIVRGAAGEERAARWHIFVDASAQLSPEGKLTLPSGYDPQTPPIWSSQPFYDETGAVHHVEITVGG